MTRHSWIWTLMNVFLCLLYRSTCNRYQELITPVEKVKLIEFTCENNALLQIENYVVGWTLVSEPFWTIVLSTGILRRVFNYYNVYHRKSPIILDGNSIIYYNKKLYWPPTSCQGVYQSYLHTNVLISQLSTSIYIFYAV